MEMHVPLAWHNIYVLKTFKVMILQHLLKSISSKVGVTNVLVQNHYIIYNLTTTFVS